MTVNPADLPYEQDRPNDYQWTDKAFDLLIAGSLEAHVYRRGLITVAVVAGKCPRCPHTFTYTTSDFAVGSGGQVLGGTRSVDASDDYVPIDAACVGNHPGRPENQEQGCGVAFRVEALPENVDG